MKYTIRLDNVQRSVDSVAAGYREQLDSITNSAMDGGDPEEIADRHRELIIASAILMFVAGMQAGGVSGDEMTGAEKAIIAAWTAVQLDHIDQYAADAVAAGKDPAERDKILARMELWIAALLALGAQGMATARSDKSGTFHLGATIEHCRTCAGLNGKRHRMSWYTSRGLLPRQMGNMNFVCKGYQCQCNIKFDDGTWLY